MCVCVCVCVCVRAWRARARACGVVYLGMCVHARAKNLSARLQSPPPPTPQNGFTPLLYKFDIVVVDK